MYYHGTTEENYKSIIENGFNIDLSDDQRWGKGIYFSDSLNTASMFGDKVLNINLDDELICKFNYSDIVKIFPELSEEDEEGTSELREYILSNTNYKIASIEYDDGEKEVIVYDESLLQ